MGNIVVGIDGSERAAAALRWAVTEARLRDWRVTAVMAWGYVNQIHVSSREFKADYGEPEARRVLGELVVAAVGEDTDVEIDELAVCDLAARALLDASADADLLVVGARGLGGIRGLALGSVSQACLHRSLTPVAIVRGGEGEGQAHQRIIVGVNGSPSSARALAWALEEGRRRGAEVEVLHASGVPVPNVYPWAGPIEYTPVERKAEELIEGMLSEADTTGLDVRRTVVDERAAAALLDAAQDADLVVLGGRNVGGFVGMMLGSVSHALAHQSPCPVVVLPEWTKSDVDLARVEQHQAGAMLPR